MISVDMRSTEEMVNKERHSLVCSPRRHDLLKERYPKRRLLVDSMCPDDCFYVLRGYGKRIIALRILE
jgi:hypothetical protein